MTFFSISNPYNIFYDNDGTPLEAGYIYVGEENKNPIANPITVYWDRNGIYPAAQPIRTVNGYISRNGTPSNIYIDSTINDFHSISILNKNQELIFNKMQASNSYGNIYTADFIDDLRSFSVFTIHVYVKNHSDSADKGYGIFKFINGAAPGTYTDNDGTIILPTGGDGSGAWIKQDAGLIDPYSFSAMGNGTADDRDAIQACIDSATSPEGIQLKKGIYYLASTLSVDTYINFCQGAILKPANGVTVNSNGRFIINDNDKTLHFDYSLGGRCTNMTYARPEYFNDGLPNAADTRQAFIDAEDSLISGGNLKLDVGSYVFSGSTSAISSTKALVITGVNPESSNILITGSECWFWKFLSSATQARKGFAIKDLSFACASNTTNGYLIDVDNTTGSNVAVDGLVSNVHFRTNGEIFGGIRFHNGVQEFTIENVIGNKSTNFIVLENVFNGLLSNIHGDGEHSLSSIGLKLSGTAAGGGTESIHVVNTWFTNFGNCMVITGTTAYRFEGVAACKFDNVYFDDSKNGAGADIGELTNSWFKGCYFVTAKDNGCRLDDCHTLHFTGCQFDHNTLKGCRVENTCSGIFFNGGSAADNNDGSLPTTGDGLWFESGVQRFCVTGMDVRGNRALALGGYNKPQNIGIYIGASCDFFIIDNIIGDSNVTAAVDNDAGTSTTKIIGNVVGTVV